MIIYLKTIWDLKSASILNALLTGSQKKIKMAMKSKNPKIELFAFTLAFADGQPTEEQNNTAVLFKIKENLDKQNLCINTIRSNVSCINLDDGSMTIKCPKLPTDTDAKYDITKNYEYIRAKGSIPVIDYNRRRENLSRQALINRGYDHNGWPFAPCDLLCRPNGFEKQYQRLIFCCFKQCLNLRAAALKSVQEKYDIAMGPHIENRTGFTKHMYVKEHPRLINKIPRGSKRYNLIKKIRSASERAYSTMKEDLKILEKPRILNAQRAAILAQMAAIVLLLHRAFKFVVKTSVLFTKTSPN